MPTLTKETRNKNEIDNEELCIIDDTEYLYCSPETKEYLTKAFDENGFYDEEKIREAYRKMVFASEQRNEINKRIETEK